MIEAGHGWQVRGPWRSSRPALVVEISESSLAPGPDLAASFGWRYRSVEVLRREAAVSPLASPDANIRVSDLLP